MILEEDYNESFFGNKQKRQERKAARQEIRQRRKEIRQKARVLRKSGDKAGGRALKKGFRQQIRALRTEKGLGLLGRIRKPKAVVDSEQSLPESSLIKTMDTAEIASMAEIGEKANVANIASGTSENGTPINTGFTPTSGSSGSGVSAGNNMREEPQEEPQEDGEKAEENTPKKPKKWLLIGIVGGGLLLIALVFIAIIMKQKQV